MATPFEGGRALGEAIFGGRQKGNSDVFLSRLRENYNTQRAMDEAASSQIQRIAREAITSADIEAARKGDMAAQARLGEAALRTADTPNLRNITAGLGDFDEAGYKRGAVEKARMGDFAGANAELVGLANGPLKVNDIDSGYQINPYDVGGDATPTATENARIGELGERANLSRVKAAGGGWAPRSGGSSDDGFTKAREKQILKEADRMVKAGKSFEEVDAWMKAQFESAGGEFTLADAATGKMPGVTGRVTPDGKGAKAAAKSISPEARERMVRMPDGRTVVRVKNPAEAKNAWAKLKRGAGLMLPNGTIRYKD